MMLKRGVLVTIIMLVLQSVNGSVGDEQSPLIEAEDVVLVSSAENPSSDGRDGPDLSLPPMQPQIVSMSGSAESPSNPSFSRDSDGEEIYEKARDGVNDYHTLKVDIPLEDVNIAAGEQSQPEGVEQDDMTFKHELQSPKPPPTLSRKLILQVGDENVPVSFVTDDTTQTPGTTPRHQPTLHILPTTTPVADDSQTPNLGSDTVIIRAANTPSSTNSTPSFVRESGETLLFPVEGQPKPVEKKQQQQQYSARIETPGPSPMVVMRRFPSSQPSKNRNN